MDLEIASSIRGRKKEAHSALLAQAGLADETEGCRIALLWDGEQLVATGAREGNLLKCIAVDAARQGEDLTAQILTALREDAFAEGHRHLFLYTKPRNRILFSSLFFYPVVQAGEVLLMESRKNGIGEFLSRLPAPVDGTKIGAAVMNCNPFTLGHRYLIETAAKECDHVYIFLLSEDKSEFSAHDRMEMARLGTADLPNVTVLPTGPYLLSAATFPTYFLKERDKAQEARCLLDIAVFERYFIPHFHITHRYVGTEPFSLLTARYNEALKTHLTIPLREIPRLEQEGQAVSASAVRADLSQCQALLPETTYRYLNDHGLLP